MRRSAGFSFSDVVVIIAVIAIILGLLLPALSRARGASRQKACANNLMQIVGACTVYQEHNGEYFPCHWDGRTILGEDLSGKSLSSRDGRTLDQARRAKDGYNNPMQSLALLYPMYVGSPRIFACPNTDDKPSIIIRWFKGHRHVGFGKPATDPETGETINGCVDASEYGGTNMMDPSDASHLAAGSQYKCSYVYDPLSHYRDIGPSQLMMADADGYSWRTADGSSPKYPKSWTRKPRKPNHADGQNVFYFDGHVRWVETNYASDEPEDNIYTPDLKTPPSPGDKTLKWLTTENMGTPSDVNAWLWDEANISR